MSDVKTWVLEFVDWFHNPIGCVLKAGPDEGTAVACLASTLTPGSAKYVIVSELLPQGMLAKANGRTLVMETDVLQVPISTRGQTLQLLGAEDSGKPGPKVYVGRWCPR